MPVPVSAATGPLRRKWQVRNRLDSGLPVGPGGWPPGAIARRMEVPVGPCFRPWGCLKPCSDGGWWVGGMRLRERAACTLVSERTPGGVVPCILCENRFAKIESTCK